MSDFLPPGYKTPESKGGNYFKPKAAESRVRVLQPPILGFEAWTRPSSDKPHGQPIRRKLDDFSDVTHDEKKGSRHFWAFAVWNYSASKVQVWEITQATIQGAIEALTYEKDWGDPRRYDLIIKRSGEGLNTQYQVLPAPPKRMTAEINEAWQALKASGFDIQRLYNNGDPFAAGGNGSAPPDEDYFGDAPPASDEELAREGGQEIPF